MIVCLDTSAAMKLVLEEAESSAMGLAIDRLQPDDTLVGSWLLHTELHCAAARRSGEVTTERVVKVLDSVSLVDILRADLIAAPRRFGGLRSQGAIHLAVATRVGADAIFTYDLEQARAAEQLGMTVLRPA